MEQQDQRGEFYLGLRLGVPGGKNRRRHGSGCTTKRIVGGPTTLKTHALDSSVKTLARLAADQRKGCAIKNSRRVC